jgi:hypothetical protein
MFDVAGDLRERFNSAMLWHLEGYEVLPDGRTITRSDEDERAIGLFEKLTGTVDEIPASVIKTVQELCESVGAAKYEEFALAAIQDVGFRSFPTNATEFFSTLYLSLQFMASTPGGFDIGVSGIGDGVT